MSKIRLDQYLVKYGLIDNIKIAESLIRQGKVLINERPMIKPGIQVNNENSGNIKLKQPLHNYVSRGALKLVRALDFFAIDPKNLICIDVGSSTGGFTEVLLERGAKQIYAVDVGYGELHYKLRNNPKITLLERTNARYLTDQQIKLQPNLIVCDASFISLTTILPITLNLSQKNCILIALIKPQFEAEKHEVPKGGIIKDPVLHQKICEKIKDWLELNYNFQIKDIIASPILGAKGNKEFLICGQRV